MKYLGYLYFIKGFIYMRFWWFTCFLEQLLFTFDEFKLYKSKLFSMKP